MAVRRYDPEAAKQDILEAAEALFVERGFERTSTAQVAKAAGVSQSQINYHFGNKQALWEEIHRLRFKEYYDAQIQLLSTTSTDPDLLSKSIRTYFEFFQSHPKFARMMLFNLAEVGGLGGDQGGHLTELGAAFMKFKQEQGEIRDDIHPAFALLSFIGLVSFWFMARHEFVPKLGLKGAPEDYDEEFLDNITKVLVRGMKGPKSHDSGDSD